jgi:hypothetical protein
LTFDEADKSTVGSVVPSNMDKQLTCLVSKVDQESTENARVDLRSQIPHLSID